MTDRSCTSYEAEIGVLQARIAELRKADRWEEADALEEDELPKLEDLRDQAHQFRFTWDWEGDPNVINGVHDLSGWQCARCGDEPSAFQIQRLEAEHA